MISIIVAKALNGVIGNKGEIPWYLPDDLKHFAKITKGHTVIMGRKTYESIVKRLGHALPERENVIITSQTDFQAPNCVIMHSVDEAIKKFSIGVSEVFVIGGSEIYKQFLPVADKLYITEVNVKCDGDAFFPTISKNNWKLIASEPHKKDDKNSCDFIFQEYTRNN